MVAAFGMAGCGSKAQKTASKPALAPVVNTPAKNIDRTGWPVIVAFGDSLTAGQGVAYDKAYPSQLQAELDRLGYKYRVVNAGISGDTTAGGLNRIDSVLAHKPQIVILELGPNDALQGMPIDNMKANLQKIIERLQQARVTVVLAGMQIPPNYGPDYTEAFRQTYIDLAAKDQLPLIPFFLDGAAAKPELNQMDGIHPTAEGYVYVVKNVMATLEPLLKK
jgi:acyl-CoA thioesterase-1